MNNQCENVNCFKKVTGNLKCINCKASLCSSSCFQEHKEKTHINIAQNMNGNVDIYNNKTSFRRSNAKSPFL
jgi:hypothetical protein